MSPKKALTLINTTKVAITRRKKLLEERYNRKKIAFANNFVSLGPNIIKFDSVKVVIARYKFDIKYIKSALLPKL